MRRLMAAAVTAVASIGLALASPTAGHAASSPSVKKSTSTVTLYATSHSYETVKVDTGCSVDWAYIEIENAAGDGYDYREIGKDGDGAFSAKFSFANDAGTGKWYVSLDYWSNCTDAEVNKPDISSFYVKRNTRFVHFNASPEPVRKGRTITVAGSLQRMYPYKYPSAGYIAYKGTSVRIEFRTKTGSYSRVATVTTSSTGHFSKHFKASRDGCWRARFLGTSHHAPDVTSGDCVNVT